MAKRTHAIWIAWILTGSTLLACLTPDGDAATDRHLQLGASTVNHPGVPGAELIKGVHWFGDAWAVNAWNTDLEAIAPREFRTIREDGFNTVTLVVPWPGFARSPQDGSIFPDQLKRLSNLIKMAGDADLHVILRVGYHWNSSVGNIAQWHNALWSSREVRSAWIQHLGEIWQAVQHHENLIFGFISWEDLWSITSYANANLKERTSFARATGFQDWLKNSYSLSEIAEIYGATFESWESVPIGHRTSSAYKLLLEYIDHLWIHEFYAPARNAFPRLSMEVRIDSDPIWKEPGKLDYWFSHEAAWDLPGAEWTTVYWSPAMGGNNEGGTVDAETALGRFVYQMERLRNVTGNRAIHVGQFLVEDFTPGFEANDKLEPGAVSQFLALAAGVVPQLAAGYSLWAWKDYVHDAIPSPDGYLGFSSWSRESSIKQAEERYLASGDSISRVFDIAEFHSGAQLKSATLCIETSHEGLGKENVAAETSCPPSSSREICVPRLEGACSKVELQTETEILIRAATPTYLRRITFFGNIQRSGIRSKEGASKAAVPYWRRFNQDLTVYSPKPFPLFSDGWMGKTLTANLAAPGSSSEEILLFKTHLPGNWPKIPLLTISIDGEIAGVSPCDDSRQHAVRLPVSALSKPNYEIVISADHTHRVDGDERRLGCIITDMSVAPIAN